MFQNRWVDNDAEAFIKQHLDNGVNADLALRVYTSQLIGSDSDLVLHGGGNTSCKTNIPDLFGNSMRVLCVKGSGWDLGTIEAPGLPAVRLDPLLELRNLSALSDEDMVNAQRSNLIDQSAPNPSVETLLHAFLPHNYIDHTHATPFLALANLPKPHAILHEIFGQRLAIVPYVMPGFALAKLAADIAEKNPLAEGLLLLQHGHFTWGDNAKQSYERIIDHTNRVEAWLADRRKKTQYRVVSSPPSESLRIINDLKKALIGSSSQPSQSFVLNWIDDPAISAQIDQHISNGVSERGVATPDHVIRIKAKPLIITQNIQKGGAAAILNAIKAYVRDYKKYFNTWSALAIGRKIMLDPLPKLAWVEGKGLIGIGNSMKEAKMITDLGTQNVRVITDGESAGGFYPVSGKDLFDMEYWSLEQAKINKNSPPPLCGKITVITGAGGEIGSAIVEVFERAGAEIIAVDIDAKALADRNFSSKVMQKTTDLTDAKQIKALTNDIVRDYGGVDILVSNAGIAPEASFLEMDEHLLRHSLDINFFAHFHLAQAFGKVFVAQKNSGQMLFNISKQAVNPGRNFGAYGLPKATLMFLVKQLALELGNYGIRVNGVNADRIRSGLLNKKMIASRAKARGINTTEYMENNLLRKEVEARHVAEAFLNLALSARTTGHVITVDGGNIEASLR